MKCTFRLFWLLSLCPVQYLYNTIILFDGFKFFGLFFFFFDVLFLSKIETKGKKKCNVLVEPYCIFTVVCKSNRSSIIQFRNKSPTKDFSGKVLKHTAFFFFFFYLDWNVYRKNVRKYPRIAFFFFFFVPPPPPRQNCTRPQRGVRAALRHNHARSGHVGETVMGLLVFVTMQLWSS